MQICSLWAGGSWPSAKSPAPTQQAALAQGAVSSQEGLLLDIPTPPLCCTSQARTLDAQQGSPESRQERSRLPSLRPAWPDAKAPGTLPTSRQQQPPPGHPVLPRS